MKTGTLFNPEKDIPDLSGKVVLVTGGNTGLGLETIVQLSRHNPAHIYLGARSEAKASDAIKEVRDKNPNAGPISFISLDLGSFASIKAAVQAFRSSSDRLDILVNNAGIMAVPEGLTEDGYEIQFGTNHLGHALLTKLLLPRLKDTAATRSSDVRVVFVSSSLENSAPEGCYHLDKINTTLPHMSTWTRYGQSKLANLHYASALAQHNPEIKVISVHPGIIMTGLSNSFIDNSNLLMANLYKFGMKFVTVSVERGALNQLWAATSRNAESGVFYYPVGIIGKGSALSNNKEVRDELWKWTEQELEPHLF